jgi:hypothetical protein
LLEVACNDFIKTPPHILYPNISYASFPRPHTKNNTRNNKNENIFCFYTHKTIMKIETLNNTFNIDILDNFKCLIFISYMMVRSSRNLKLHCRFEKMWGFTLEPIFYYIKFKYDVWFSSHIDLKCCYNKSISIKQLSGENIFISHTLLPTSKNIILR